MEKKEKKLGGRWWEVTLKLHPPPICSVRCEFIVEWVEEREKSIIFVFFSHYWFFTVWACLFASLWNFIFLVREKKKKCGWKIIARLSRGIYWHKDLLRVHFSVFFHINLLNVPFFSLLYFLYYLLVRGCKNNYLIKIHDYSHH